MKRNNKWRNFEFGDTTKPKASKKLFNVKKPFNYEEKVEPKTVEDLAVHSKKIQDLRTWLETFVINKPPTQKTASFLIITGPTGSGKSITLKVLCKTLDLNLTEWINPVDLEFHGQKTKFLEFLIESKWKSLFGESGKKVLVVEEFPNAIVRNPTDFFDILEECFYNANYPIIFICTDNNLQQNLFPLEIQIKYSIREISFNPCATSLLKGALKRAQKLSSESPDIFKIVNQSTIEAIVATALGDIRNALNQFYFAALKGSDQLPLTTLTTTTNPKKRKRNESVLKTICRDENLGLFHGLGRVLNPKQEDDLLKKIESVIDEFGIKPKIFYDFLFENYLKYFGDFNEIVATCDYLSLSQLFYKHWDNHDCLTYALWLAVMALMVFNKTRISKWNQIRGPRRLNNPNKFKQNNLHISDYSYYCKIFNEQKPFICYTNLSE